MFLKLTLWGYGLQSPRKAFWPQPMVPGTTGPKIDKQQQKIKGSKFQVI